MAPEFLVFHCHSKYQHDFHVSHCTRWSYFSYILWFPSQLLSSPFFFLSLLVATQSWGHIAGLPIAESRLPVKKRNFWGLGFCVFRRKSPGVWSAGMILYMWAPRTPNFAAKQTNNSWWFQQGLIQHVWSVSGSISKKRCKHFHFCAVKAWKLRYCLVNTLTHYIIVFGIDPTQSVVRTFARNTSDMPRRTWRWRISFPPPWFQETCC